MSDLKQNLDQLKSFSEKVKSIGNKPKDQIGFTFDQLQALRQKISEAAQKELHSEQQRRELIIKANEYFSVLEKYLAEQLNLQEAVRQLTVLELSSNIDFQVLPLKIDSEARKRNEPLVDADIKQTVKKFDDDDDYNDWMLNSGRQQLYGFLEAAKLVLTDEQYNTLYRQIRDIYNQKGEFSWKDFENLKLYGDNTASSHLARRDWLVNPLREHLGFELVGYWAEMYLGTLLMDAEKRFQIDMGEGDKSDGLYYQYKRYVFDVLLSHKAQLQEWGKVRTGDAYRSRYKYPAYIAGYKAQNAFIQNNIATPKEWHEALQKFKNPPQKPLEPPTPAVAPRVPGAPLTPSIPRDSSAPNAPSVSPRETGEVLPPIIERYQKEILNPYILYIPSMPYIHWYAAENKDAPLPKLTKMNSLVQAGVEIMKLRGNLDTITINGIPYSTDLSQRMAVAQKEFIEELKAFFAVYKPKILEACKDLKSKFTPDQMKSLEALEKADFSRLNFADLNKLYVFLVEMMQYGVPFYAMKGLEKPADGTDDVKPAPASDTASGDKIPGTPGSPGEAPTRDSGGKTDGATGGGKKPPEKPKEEGPSVDEIRKNASKFCTLDKYYRVSFSSEKAEKVLRLHDVFLPDNGSALMVIPSADVGKARMAVFDPEDKRYEYNDGKPAKFLKGYQVLQGFSDMEIVGRYEAALTFDMPRDVDSAAQYVGKRYEKLKSAVATGLDSRVALAVLETTMARLDRLLKDAKRDSFWLDLMPGFSVQWKNPGADGSRRQGFMLDDIVRVGYAFGIGKPAATPDDTGSVKKPGDASDDMILPSLDGTEKGPEKTPEGLPEDVKLQLQESFSKTLKTFVQLMNEANSATSDKDAYLKWVDIGVILENFEKLFEKGLRKYHQKNMEFSIPKVDSTYGPKTPEKITLEDSPNTSMSLRDFAYYAGMIDDAKKDTPFYRFMERVERYMAEFQEK